MRNSYTFLISLSRIGIDASLMHRLFRGIRLEQSRMIAVAAIICVISFGAASYAQSSLSNGVGDLQTPTVAGPNRPASVPEGYVVTPNGYFHPSCVMEVLSGDIVRRDEKVIEHADGTREDIPTCGYPRYTAKGNVVYPDGTESAESSSVSAPTPDSSTYIEYGYLTTSTSYAGVIGQLNVPSNPASSNGQTVFFFPGLEDDQVAPPDGTILQPVLGWNAFSSEAGWSIASWNCCYGYVDLYSTPKAVSAGDLIIGEVYSNCASGSQTCSTWYVSTDDAGKSSTVLSSTSSYGQTFNFVLGAAMEVYDIAQCSDYPSNGSTEFTSVVYAENGDTISDPSWTTPVDTSATPQCGYGITSSDDGQYLTLSY